MLLRFHISFFLFVSHSLLHFSLSFPLSSSSTCVFFITQHPSTQTVSPIFLSVSLLVFFLFPLSPLLSVVFILFSCIPLPSIVSCGNITFSIFNYVKSQRFLWAKQITEPAWQNSPGRPQIWMNISSFMLEQFIASCYR